MKMLRIPAILSVILALSASRGMAAAEKLGYIDVPRILEEYEGFKEARKDLDRDKKTFEDDYGRRGATLQKMMQEIQESAKMLSEAKKKEKAVEFEKKRKDFMEWQQDQSRRLQEREEGIIKRLEGDVRKVLERVGADGGYAFVVRRDLLLYVRKDSTDLTDQVLAALRKQMPAAPKGSESKGK